jgi:exopolysaccharide biosynthesis polyprenyl glycosylphosphotransferase
MTRRRSALASLAIPAGDFLLIVGVFLLGYWIRHFAIPAILPGLFGPPAGFRLSATHYLISGTVMGAVQIILLQAFGSYRESRGVAGIEELVWILRSSFMAVVITFAVSFAARQHFYSRFVLVFAFPAVSIALAVWHRGCRRMLAAISRKAGRLRKAVLYGCGELARDLSAHLAGSASIPCSVFGFIKPLGSSDPCVVEAFEHPADLSAWMKERSIDLLVVADTTLPRDETAGVIWSCEHSGLSYMLVPDVFTLVSHTTRVTSLAGTALIESVPPPLRGFRRMFKRGIDMTLVLVALPFLALPGLLLALAVALDSKGPVFYVQTRLGRENKPFLIYKFRSMRVGADREKAALLGMNEASGPIFKMKSDPRVTRVGRFLRRWSLDELPQIINVLRGEMSLVGPRPPIPEEVESYSERHLKRLQTIPGMTGIWQVSGRSQLGFEEMVKLDLYYMDNWSVWLDMAILLLTVPAALSRRGAY